LNYHLGHLRYGAQGKNNNAELCHPFIKRDIHSCQRNLALAENFNLVNTEELFGLINLEPGIFKTKVTWQQ
jgi:amidophosphoribosyltransferase